jgi:aryl-alcohol dehydrogenase-like predicted oxidoreductase
MIGPGRRVGDRAVSPIGLGGARWSLVDDPDEAAAVATMHAALDAGVNLFDTALAYTSGTQAAHNEELMGSALRRHPRGSEAIIATKGGHFRDSTGGFPIDARPPALRAHCRASLAALNVDAIDLYQLHWPDPHVPLTESVGTLAELREQGLIRLVGICNVTLEQLAEARSVTRVDAVQNRFSPLDTAGRPVLDQCARLGIPYLAYSPLGGPTGAQTMARQLPAFADVAGARGASVQEIAVAWLVHQSPSIIPIVGAGRPERIVAAARAAALCLDDVELASLNDAVDAIPVAEQM